MGTNRDDHVNPPPSPVPVPVAAPPNASGQPEKANETSHTVALPETPPPPPSSPGEDVVSSAEDNDAPTSFFSASNMQVASVQIIGGTFAGYAIGYVGVYATLYGFSTNCALYSTQKGCETVPNADCKWFAGAGGSAGYCGWPDITCRMQYPNDLSVYPTTELTIAACEADSRCVWSYSGSECRNPTGYSTSNSGIFAGVMILGGAFGSSFGGPLNSAIGPKLSFLLVGIIGVVCSVMYHVSAAENEFWVLIVGRFVLGLIFGIIGVACPVYVDQNGHPKYKRMIGVLFQLFTTFGILIAAVIGLAVGQSVYFDKDKDHMLMARMQALAAFSTVICIAMIMLGVLIPEKINTGPSVDSSDEDAASKLDPNEYTYGQMLPRLLTGVTMAAAMQLTGFNAVMNYAPTIMGNLGLAPLVGNIIVMVWNFLSTIGSIPLAGAFTMRQLYLAGAFFTSCMCLFLCGIPVYPGVTKKKAAKDGVAITGILLFIMGFEFAVGPCYFVLTQDMFPPSFRPKGASLTQVTMFFFNFVINVCYPIATEGLSGGPSGNQDKGQAIAFIFFGCLGLCFSVILVFSLYPWEEKDAAKVKEGENTKKDYQDLEAAAHKAENQQP